MKKFKVVFEVYRSNTYTENKTVSVEAGNKKLACTRAMAEINRQGDYSGYFKKIKSVEEVA